MEDFQMPKVFNILIFPIALLLLGLGIWTTLRYEKEQFPSQLIYSGQIINVTDNSIEIISSQTGENQQTGNQDRITIYYDNSTEIIETLTPIISKEDLARIGREVNPAILSKIVHPGAISVLKEKAVENISVTIRTRENSLGLTGKLHAEEINYEIIHYIKIGQ